MLAENIIKEEISSLKNGPINKTVKAKNTLKNNGIKINANGINTLKFSSNVSEFVIQDTPVR